MENIFHTSQEDNVTSLSCDDRKNRTGHWEMPLPFRQMEVRMPNNRNQAVNRLNGHRPCECSTKDASHS